MEDMDTKLFAFALIVALIAHAAIRRSYIGACGVTAGLTGVATFVWEVVTHWKVLVSDQRAAVGLVAFGPLYLIYGAMHGVIVAALVGGAYWLIRKRDRKNPV
jgi:hypothetical protein